MSTETLQPVEPDQSLINRLYELQPDKDETQAALLGRRAVVASEFNDHILTEKELAYVGDLLPRWNFSHTRVRNNNFGIARRLDPPSPGQQEKISEYRTPRRLISFESGNLVLLARTALSADDIASIFEIEQANGFLHNSPAVLPPKPEEKRRESSTGKAELRGSSGLHLTPSEFEVVQLRALCDAEICERLDITPSALRKRLGYAIQRNQKSVVITKPEELIIKAIEGDLIDMSLLPPPKNYELSDIQQKIAQKHMFNSLLDTMNSLDLSSEAEVSAAWTSIYREIGAFPPLNNRIHAYLILKRDGKI